MSATTDFTAFANQVYLVIKNRFIDGLAPGASFSIDEDNQTKLSQVAEWVNMYLDELETEVGPDGRPIDWTWSRSTEFIGTARLGKTTVPFDTEEFLNLIADGNRYVQVISGSKVISNFTVVSPGQLSNKSGKIVGDRVALVGENLVFSRAFNSDEAGGRVFADVTTPLPRVTYTVASDASGTVTFTNVDVLTTVQPKLLLQLGVAKNASLPDIVQGQLSPSYAQKYADLLNGAIARSLATSSADEVETEDFSYISGVGF